MNYDDGIKKIVHPENKKNLDGFMIGRAAFWNPWCFLTNNYEPTLEEILNTMKEHGDLLWIHKEKKGMMEARKHLVQYLHWFPGVKEYRSSLVQVNSPEDIYNVLNRIRSEHPITLNQKISNQTNKSLMMTWEQ